MSGAPTVAGSEPPNGLKPLTLKPAHSAVPSSSQSSVGVQIPYWITCISSWAITAWDATAVASIVNQPEEVVAGRVLLRVAEDPPRRL